MKSKELDHVLRAVDEVTNVAHPFLLIGSQAILAHIDPEYFPELVDCEVLFVSKEVDVAVLSEERDLQEKLADVIDGSFGQNSHFDQTHGYHADGVEVGTATLAQGWKERLKPYESIGVPAGKFFALSYEDLAVSKLMAGRPKDIEFVRGMCRAQPHHPGLQVIEGLLLSFAPSPVQSKALALWKTMVPSPPSTPAVKNPR